MESFPKLIKGIYKNEFMMDMPVQHTLAFFKHEDNILYYTIGDLIHIKKFLQLILMINVRDRFIAMGVTAHIIKPNGEEIQNIFQEFFITVVGKILGYSVNRRKIFLHQRINNIERHFPGFNKICF